MNTVPNLGMVASFELLKLGRRGKVRSVIAWTALILGLSVASVYLGYMVTATPEAFLNFVLQPSLFMLYLSVGGCILAGDVVVSEFEHKTCFISFTNPIKRSTLLLGKYLACLVVIFGALAAYFSASSVVVYAMFGVFLPQTFLSFFYSVITGASILGVVFLFSSAMKGSSSATMSSLLVLTFSFQLLVTLLLLWGIEPWFLLNYAAVIINAAIQPFQGGPDTLVSVAVLIVYVAVALMASIWVIDKKELS